VGLAGYLPLRGACHNISIPGVPILDPIKHFLSCQIAAPFALQPHCRFPTNPGRSVAPAVLPMRGAQERGKGHGGGGDGEAIMWTTWRLLTQQQAPSTCATPPTFNFVT